MYITPEQLEQRLNRTEIQYKERERKVRKEEKRLSHEDRVVIGVLEQEDGLTHKDIGELLGVSAQTVSHVGRGLTSPTIGVDQELKTDVAERVAERGELKLQDNKKIQEQLITNLAAALGQVAINLDSTDANEASKIAVDMSKILDRVTGGREDRHGNKTAIIINVPSMKEEKNYPSITV